MIYILQGLSYSYRVLMFHDRFYTFNNLLHLRDLLVLLDPTAPYFRVESVSIIPNDIG